MVNEAERTTRTSELLAAIAAGLAVLALLNTIAGDPLGLAMLRSRLPLPAAKVAGPHVVVILVDTLRADHLGYHGYARDTSPRIDAFAREGLRFMHARSNAPWTKPSVGTLLTGRHHEGIGLTRLESVLPPTALTAFEAFAQAGYHTALLNGGSPHVTEEVGFAQGAAHYEYFQFADTREYWIAGRNTCDPVVSRFLEVLDTPREAPLFAYLHLMDVHLPYYAHAGNEHFGPGPGVDWQPGAITAPMIRESRKTVDEATRQGFVNLYDGQIRAMDACLAPLFERVSRALGGGERPVLAVFTADHGEELWERGAFEHGHTMYDEQLHVPLVFGGNAVSPRVVEAPVQLMDVLPTLLELAWAPHVRPEFEGRSFAALVKGRAVSRGAPFYASSTLYRAEAKALVLGPYKLIQRFEYDPTLQPLDRDERPGFELYDLEADPKEQHDVAAAQPELVRLLAEELARRYDGGVAPAPEPSKALDDDERRQLEALGYLDPS